MLGTRANALKVVFFSVKYMAGNEKRCAGVLCDMDLCEFLSFANKK